MSVCQQITECEDPEVQELIVSACYSGERAVIKEKNGATAALVPIEDLEILEEMEELDNV